MRIAILLALLLGLSRPLFSDQNLENSFCFSQLTKEELSQDWAKEYKIGLSFASDYNYTDAIYVLNRSIYLCEDPQRLKEIEYAAVLSYYHDQKYLEATQFFETHSLLYANHNFGAYHDLMTILHHCYAVIGQEKKANLILEQIKEVAPDEFNAAALSGALLLKDFEKVKTLSKGMEKGNWIYEMTNRLFSKQKSSTVARWLNVFLPGMGYFYLGQKKAALCAFLLNGCLIFGTVQLFLSHYYTLGALTAIFEMGWYFGGIVGAKEAAHNYNEALYTSYLEKVLFCDEIDPNGKLKYDF